jgi:hypothetical protein
MVRELCSFGRSFVFEFFASISFTGPTIASAVATGIISEVEGQLWHSQFPSSLKQALQQSSPKNAASTGESEL